MKPLLSGHFRDLLKCPLNFAKTAQRLLTINTQRLLCTVIKFDVVKEAKEVVLYICKTFRSTLIADDNYTTGYQSNLQFIDSYC